MQIKYMGGADCRKIPKGTDFGGQLSKEAALDTDIEWNWDNNHVIDTSEFESVDEEFWNLLLEQPDFKDVSDLKRIPTNLAQQTWKGMPKSEEAEKVLGDDGDDESSESEEQAESVARASGGGDVSEASDTGATTTTTGGSTSGDSTTGGSTKGRTGKARS